MQPTRSLPRELILAILSIAVIGGGAWLLWEKMRDPSATDSRETTPVPHFLRKVGDTPFGKGDTPASRAFDSDGDGLLNWEEKLWGTNENERDSDGDGVTDGKEVASKRDPNRPGPNDSLETPLMVMRQKEWTPPPPEQASPEKQPPSHQNVTPPLVRGRQPPSPTFQKKWGTPPLVRGKQSSQTYKSSSQTNSSEDMGELPGLPSLDLEESAAGNESLRIFGNNVGALIKTAAADSEAELAFWNSAAGATKMTKTLLEGFANLATKYEVLAEDIAAVAPSEEAETPHAKLSEAYAAYAKSIRGISKTLEGSYMASASIMAYSDAALAVGRAIVATSDFFYENNVRFGATEPGTVFMFPR